MKIRDEAHWRRLDALFREALESEGEEREALLSDPRYEPELPGAVRELLDSEADAEMALGDSVDVWLGTSISGLLEGLTSEDDGTLSPGELVGPWRIVEEIGQGGMARVYRADRDDGEFVRTVALKVVKRGIDTAEVVRRFRAERQILASLDHPNIARLYDGGLTPDGRPYLVMELVEGRRITDHCAEEGATLAERIGLVLGVCDAVMDAHRALVVHRDLKPSNILVTAAGTPKLLDFGIAKILDPEWSGAEPPTRTGLRVMTPEYAAPEQIRGGPVTTGTDVYGLGMVLFELVAGRRPFDLDGLSPAEAERTLLEREAPTPSSFSEAGRSRLARDLDAIVLRALEKDPAQRYGSVAELSGDLVAALKGRPLVARPLGPLARMGRGLRRHWVPSSIAAAFVLLLAGWAVSSAIQRARLEEALEVAEEQRAVAEDVGTFMEDMFSAADPFPQGPQRRDTVPIGSFLQEAAGRVRADLVDQPAVQARALSMLGRLNRSLGRWDSAAVLLEAAVEVERSLHPEDHEDVAGALTDLGNVYQLLGRLSEAEPLNREVAEMQRRLRGADEEPVALALSNLASVIQDQGRLEEALPLYDSALAIMARQERVDSTALLTMLNPRAVLAYRMGDLEAAEESFTQLVDLQRARLDPGHPVLAREVQNLAFLHLRMGKSGEAVGGFEEALSILEPTLGAGHPQVAVTRGNYAEALHMEGRYQEAEAAFSRAVQDQRNTGAGLGPPFANTLVAWGNLKVDLEALSDAESFYREALDIDRAALGSEHPSVGLIEAKLGSVLCDEGRGREGRSDLERAVVVLEAALPADAPGLAGAREDLIRCPAG